MTAVVPDLLDGSRADTPWRQDDARPARLRIALLCPPWFPVPPVRYGGIERVVALLADGLVDAGHDVTLFASGDSTTKAELAAVYPRAPSESIGETSVLLRHALACYERAQDFDVVGDHIGPLGLALGGLVSTPDVHTVHGALDDESGALYVQLCGLVPNASLVSLSLAQRRPRPRLPWVANVPNAVDPSRYPVQRRRGDYLLFLGRMGPAKGCHTAIAVAGAAGLPLKIAAKMREPAERQYFDAEVAPRLGGAIEYVGEVDEDEKVELLLGARATLFPLAWEEPFGLAMVESMACGVPVIATRRGSVAEVVVHRRTGIVVDDAAEMPAAVLDAEEIDPLACRRHVEERFGPRRLVRDYVMVFRDALERAAVAPG